MTTKELDELQVGDRVVTTLGTGTITSVKPVPMLVTADMGPAIQVDWEVNGEHGHYVGCGADKIEMAALDVPDTKEQT